ncbi:hypothetical protein KG089_05695 [Carnobacteriaceae bacterium zg-ZUI252]|nr:hypothetical protein [Carnobacteriaceae bacterium zg-ZUI252]
MKKSTILLFGACLLCGCSTTTTQQTNTTTKPAPQTASSTQKATETTTQMTTTMTTVKASQKKMDTDAIAKGDFSSVVGTWRNKAGYELTFDKNGLVGGSLRIGDVTKTDKITYAQAISSAGPGFILNFIPSGTSIPDDLFYEGNDTTDMTRDRMFGAQAKISGKTLDPYYRVNE